MTTNKHEFFLDTDTYGINLHGLTRIILAAELLASFVFSASSALKANFVTEHCLRPQAAWPEQLRFKLTGFIFHGLLLVVHMSYVVSFDYTQDFATLWLAGGSRG